MATTNLSKIKRDEMIKFLEILKKAHMDDKSIRAFNEIENALTSKRFGLIFEEHMEEVDEHLKENIPVFCADATRQICEDQNQPYNFIIEGDNLQALYLLQKTHRGKIDCIYIDPPYNTGAKNWKYNNDYVDSNDNYRHSKWLSMMSKRLRLAKKLLKDDGVLICAIDENELATLKLLIEDESVFGISYQVDVISIVQNPRGIQGDNFSYTNEYALFVYKKHYKVICDKEVEETEVDWSPLRNWGSESLRTDAKNCFYGIRIKNGKIVGFDDVLDDNIHPQKNEVNSNGEITIYPVDNNNVERKWRYARQTVESIVNILKAEEKNGVWDIYLGKPYAPYKTVWTDKKYDANEYGTQLINSMVPNNDFDFPKSLWNVYECLFATTRHKRDAIILDFFAGSGTTGHAVELLNKLYGGNRKYILVTNNAIGEKKEKEFKKIYGKPEDYPQKYMEYEEKYGICSSITYPRLLAVIKGYTHSKDFKEILYEKKFNNQFLNKIEEEKNKIERTINENLSKYDEVKKVYENNSIKIIGLSQKKEKIKGIPHNLKYFKCDWTPRKPKDYLLSNALCFHIKEMIELENAIDIDNERYVVIFNRDDFKKYVLDENKFKKIKKLWVNQNIIFDANEIKLLSEKDFKYLPGEYFSQELKEAAE